jgi:DNA topoisomerase-2
MAEPSGPSGPSAPPGSPKPATSAKKRTRTVEEEYQRPTPIEHVLRRPGMYIGSVEARTEAMWVLDDTGNDANNASDANNDAPRMVLNPTAYVPGLYKVFDEVVVNAADNDQLSTDKTPMRAIKIEVDPDPSGCIRVTVWNDGRGIPVRMHAKERMYVPELVFGHLLASSNLDDSQRKTTGGRHGYGAKLANIFATEFTVECNDVAAGHLYRQTWRANMSKRGEPKLTKARGKSDWTRISFVPDLAHFGLKPGDDALKGTVALMRRRAYDLAATTSKRVGVYWAKKRIGVADLKQYAQMFVEPGTKLVHVRPHPRWEVVVAPSPAGGGFKHMSFVNSVATWEGGTHLEHVVWPISEYVADEVKRKTRAKRAPMSFRIQDHMWVFVSALVENPEFSSQTKEKMTSPEAKFGSRCRLGPAVLKRMAATGVLEAALGDHEAREKQALKRTDGRKSSHVAGVPKLNDAAEAGGVKSARCTPVLTDGNSAKALAVAGISALTDKERRRYGVFPLRGKLLNVREATAKQRKENAEIGALKKILGLREGAVYSDRSGLRYGRVVLFVDADPDGAHICMLVANLFADSWPSLLRMPGFLYTFVTPVVVARKRGEKRTFHTVGEYEQWKRSGAAAGWSVKYYKGLGTSTSQEGKEYFRALADNLVPFRHTGADDDAALARSFTGGKKGADARKQWMLDAEADSALDHRTYMPAGVPFHRYVDTRLLEYSRLSVVRSLPSAVDGLKISQRKILFACFKRRLTSEIKVAQLAGYVSEHAAYHHGEASLQATIVGLAQSFTGSNNVPLLHEGGQFGTRLAGGKDAASARYIFTRLLDMARLVYPEEDDALLAHLEEDGARIEPRHYMPVVPMVLVNGTKGIGTGWSTEVPSYHPRAVVRALKARLDWRDDSDVPMDQRTTSTDLVPWYRGFKGRVRAVANGRFSVNGVYEVRDGGKTVVVTELPVGTWTTPYIEWLDKKAADPKSAVRSHNDESTETRVHITVRLAKPIAADDVLAELKLGADVKTDNMHMFDAEGRVHRYRTPDEVLEAFAPLRLDAYRRRRLHVIERLERETAELANRVAFVRAVCAGTLVVTRRPTAELTADLTGRGWAMVDQDNVNPSVAYLLDMPLHSLTLERVERLERDAERRQRKLERMRGRTPAQLWRADLEALDKALAAMEGDRAAPAPAPQSNGSVKKRKASQKAKDKGKTKRPKTHGDPDDVFV